MARTMIVAAGFAVACTGPPAVQPMRSVDTGWIEEGEASWYGPGFHGKQTASGEVYDMDALTAAHRELPFGSHVKVVNLENGREVQVRINDRGPFAKGRVLDVSRAAARQIEMIGPGTARVRIEVLRGVTAPPRPMVGQVPIPEECSLVQVGAFNDRRNAAETVRRLKARGETVSQRQAPDGMVRVLVGPFDTPAETRLVLDRYDGLLRPCEP